MTFQLNPSDFSFLKKYSPESIQLTSIISSSPIIRFDVTDVSEFQLRINDSVLEFGLDDEDTVNDIGKRLYNIYDELLYQKHENKAP